MGGSGEAGAVLESEDVDAVEENCWMRRREEEGGARARLYDLCCNKLDAFAVNLLFESESLRGVGLRVLII